MWPAGGYTFLHSGQLFSSNNERNCHNTRNEGAGIALRAKATAAWTDVGIVWEAEFMTHTLKQTLMKVKNQVPEQKKKAVVYQVPCKDCHQLYTGESKRTLKVRLAEHRKVVQKSDVNNGIAMHVASTSHNIDCANARVVKTVIGY